MSGIQSNILPKGDRLPATGKVYAFLATAGGLAFLALAGQWSIEIDVFVRLLFGAVGVYYFYRAWIAFAKRRVR